MIHFGSDLAESMVGASLAFVVDAIVTVVVTLRTQPKPIEELQGLVYGMANTDDERAGRTRGGSHRSCWASCCVGAAILTIVFW